MTTPFSTNDMDRDSGIVDLPKLMREMGNEPAPPAPAPRPSRRWPLVLAFVAGSMSTLVSGVVIASIASMRVSETREETYVMERSPSIDLVPAVTITHVDSPKQEELSFETPAVLVRPDAIDPIHDASIDVAAAEPLTLEGAMRAAVGEDDASNESGIRIAAPNEGGIVDHPTLGQINATLNPVLRDARSCLPADGRPVHAKVVFDSSGNVVRVIDADECVARHLRTMHVPAFTQETYTVSVVVRP